MVSTVMPHLSPSTGHETDDAPYESSQEDVTQKHARRSSLLRNAFQLLRRHNGEDDVVNNPTPQIAPPELFEEPESLPSRPQPSSPDNACRKKAIPSLPRLQTLDRRDSERREKLLEVSPSPSERRALSTDRHPSCGPGSGAAQRSTSRNASSRPQAPILSFNVPLTSEAALLEREHRPYPEESSQDTTKNCLPPDLPPALDDLTLIDSEAEYNEQLDRDLLQEEHDRRWILNLSMHFRDKSNREKFFVTYAEKPNLWRRVTISLDYRNAPPDSLEADLSTIHYQRDKSFRIYEAIRESLAEIQYYDTVTNLKLETTPEDGQLHVHVREDANEIIQYPSISMFDHVRCPRFNEAIIDFDSHLSGFVYKVHLGDRTVIKKEIPGPDTVDEFMYEVNALDASCDSENVIKLEGLVTDDHGTIVKGLLISFASQGAVVDMIYDFRKSSQLPWHRREKWAKQIVNGLSDIHEAGFVQGDFTLSNIVIDEEDNAQIIDINRRGCPVGWEPPELGRLIDSGQRIGMCISTKTDLFQLGMVLWALAEEVDEPERVERPLPPVSEGIPSYFRKIVSMCLGDRPQGRSSAKELLRRFPPSAGKLEAHELAPVEFVSDAHALDTHRLDREYINPAMAVTLEDVKGRRGTDADGFLSSDTVTYVNPDSNLTSTTYQFESSGSWIVGRPSRGRSPVSSRRWRGSPYARSPSSATSLSANSSRRRPGTGHSCKSLEYPPTLPEAFGLAASETAFAPSSEHIAPTSEPSGLAHARDKSNNVPFETGETPFATHLVHADSGFVDGSDDLDLLRCAPNR